MLKQNLLKSVTLTVVFVCMFLLTACDGDSAKKNAEQAPSQEVVETKKEQSTSDSSATESESKPSETSPESKGNAIAKINGGADETGIYSTVVRLTDQAADKGVVEMVYHGAKGSPQENSIVNTFRIEYYKESDGTFEIQTFFNGDVYQNLHHKDEVKVVNTFDATLRAGDVIVSYTPDGGDTQEIFRADAAYFYAPAN
ncbi:MAG: hypothetical protein MJ080_02705 [Clostridia bacterium]|nr:hypothetical protein [Clostridia bacterium]